MAINIEDIALKMTAAAAEIFKGKWPGVRDYAATEFGKIAASIALIEKLKTSGTINDAEARLQFDIQKNASRAILCTVEGLGILAVEEAINAAIQVVQKTVNTALGFTLL